MTNRKYGSTSFMSPDAMFHYQRAKASLDAAVLYAESSPGLNFILNWVGFTEASLAAKIHVRGLKK